MENATNQVVSNFLILHLVGLKEEKFWITLSSHLKFALCHRQSQAGDIHKLSVIITVKVVFTLIVSPCRSYNFNWTERERFMRIPPLSYNSSFSAEKSSHWCLLRNKMYQAFVERSRKIWLSYAIHLNKRFIGKSWSVKMNPTSTFCCKNGRHTLSHIYAVRNCGILISLILSEL